MILGRIDAEDGKTQLWIGRSKYGNLYLGITVFDLENGDIPTSEYIHLSAAQETVLIDLLSEIAVRCCVEGLSIETTAPSDHDVNCPYWGA